MKDLTLYDLLNNRINPEKAKRVVITEMRIDGKKVVGMAHKGKIIFLSRNSVEYKKMQYAEELEKLNRK